MKSLKVLVATALGVLVGGFLGLVLSIVLVNGLDVVDGPPAVVLLVLSVIGFAALCRIVTLIFSLRWVRNERQRERSQ